MKSFKQIVCTILLLFSVAYAQQTIPASGGVATDVGGTLSFSIGQVFYQNHLDEVGAINEGVQQPFEIFIVTGIEEFKGITLYLNAYPNPVSNLLTLQVDYEQFDAFQNLTFQLFDVNGRVVDEGKVHSWNTSIGMADKQPAVYFLTIMDHHKELKTFKIIKN